MGFRIGGNWGHWGLSGLACVGLGSGVIWRRWVVGLEGVYWVPLRMFIHYQLIYTKMPRRTNNYHVDRRKVATHCELLWIASTCTLCASLCILFVSPRLYMQTRPDGWGQSREASLTVFALDVN